ncbi:hypothetical protein MP228_013105 [Amoeboaphelidium protococcarum]|nr:hypothetical protein MP228_013105 [Amoeboaphelidium protococcarum]
MSSATLYRSIQKKSQLCKFIQEDYESAMKYNVKFSGSKDLNGDQVIIVDLNDDLKPQEFYLILEIASELHKHNNSDDQVGGDSNETTVDGVQVQQQQSQLKVTMIFDCENLTASYGINVASYFDHIKQLNRKYPHCINVCMFVNMNWIVKGFFSVLPTSGNSSNGLNMNRVKFISNYDDITEYIDPSQVPIKYGGYHHLPYDDNADYYQFIMRQLMEIDSVKEMVERIQQDQSGLLLNEIQESPPSTDNLLLVSSSSSSFTAAAAALYQSGEGVESLALSNGLKNAYSLFDSMHQDSEDEYVDCRDDAMSVMSREQQYHTARSYRSKVSVHPNEDLQAGRDDDDDDVQLQGDGKISGRYKNTLNKIKNWFQIIIGLVQKYLISNLTSQLSFKEKFLALLISLVILRRIYPKQN